MKRKWRRIIHLAERRRFPSLSFYFSLLYFFAFHLLLAEIPANLCPDKRAFVFIEHDEYIIIVGFSHKTNTPRFRQPWTIYIQRINYPSVYKSSQTRVKLRYKLFNIIKFVTKLNNSISCGGKLYKLFETVQKFKLYI